MKLHEQFKKKFKYALIFKDFEIKFWKTRLYNILFNMLYVLVLYIYVELNTLNIKYIGVSIWIWR